MKYSKITPLIKKTKQLAIHTPNSGEQWISNGVAAYPILGMPHMSESEMLTFLGFQLNDDISATNWKANSIYLSDTAVGEELIKAFGPALTIGEDSCTCFYTSLGAFIVKDKYLKPCRTHYGEGELTFWLRMTEQRNPLICVKKGLYLLAAINPLKTWGIGDKLLEEYDDFVTQLRLANENFKETETDET